MPLLISIVAVGILEMAPHHRDTTDGDVSIGGMSTEPLVSVLT